MTRPILVFVVAVAFIGGFIYVDHTWLDPGGRGFAGEANDACREHGGVRWMNAYQGSIVCMDGWAAE
jgi:hypothetical protein